MNLPRAASASRSLTLFNAAKHFGWPCEGSPRICELTVTYDCNARCLFCYNPDTVRAAARRMDLREVSRILYDSRQRLGCWAAFFTGGDATMHPDLPKFMALAKRIGYSCISVDTNGLRLSDPAYARRLVEAGANEFGLSLHGATPEVHDNLVGVPGAWKRCLKALENLKKYKVHIKINFAANRLNHRGLPRLVELMIRRYGEAHLCVVFPHYRGAMWENRRRLGLSYTDVVPSVREALEVYGRERTDIENRMLINFPPCVLPGYEDLLSDWSSCGGSEDYLFLPEGARGRVGDMMGNGRMKTPACSRCVYDGRCMGFELGYHAAYGSREFKPLLRMPRPVLSRAKLEGAVGLSW